MSAYDVAESVRVALDTVRSRAPELTSSDQLAQELLHELGLSSWSDVPGLEEMPSYLSARGDPPDIEAIAAEAHDAVLRMLEVAQARTGEPDV